MCCRTPTQIVLTNFFSLQTIDCNAHEGSEFGGDIVLGDKIVDKCSSLTVGAQGLALEVDVQWHG
jgi:hypothetical protein